MNYSLKTHCYVKSFLNSLVIYSPWMSTFLFLLYANFFLVDFHKCAILILFFFLWNVQQTICLFYLNIILTLNLYFFLFLSFSCHRAKPFISRCWFTVYYNNTHVPKDDTDDKMCVNGYYSKNRLTLLLNSIWCC